MSDERTRDQLIGEALVAGLSWSDLTGAGPGRTEGNADRPLANALSYLLDIGHTDAEGGDVESPVGHFARIERWVVVTDSQGFVEVHAYDTVAEARTAFEAAELGHEIWEGS